MASATHGGPNLRRAAIGLILLSALYLALLLWADARNPSYAGISRLAPWLPLAMAMAWAGWGLRYLRWHWLLHRAGQGVGLASGLPAYVAGFAFTATPGKLGELLRIRYFGWHGVSAARVTAAFVFERALDLICLLLLALPAAAGLPGFGIALVFVVAVIGLVGLLAWRPMLLSAVVAALRRRGLRRLARAARVLRDGFSGCRIWLRPLDLALSLGLGLAAWSFIAATLGVLLLALGRRAAGGGVDAGLSAGDAGGCGLDAAGRARLDRGRNGGHADHPGLAGGDGIDAGGGHPPVHHVVGHRLRLRLRHRPGAPARARGACRVVAAAQRRFISSHSRYRPLSTTTAAPATTSSPGTWPKTSQPSSVM